MNTPRFEDGVHFAHQRMEASRDQGHPELHLGYADMGREMEDRASPILVGRFSKDRWITHLVLCKGTQHRWIVWKRCERRDHERRAEPWW